MSEKFEQLRADIVAILERMQVESLQALKTITENHEEANRQAEAKLGQHVSSPVEPRDASQGPAEKTAENTTTNLRKTPHARSSSAPDTLKAGAYPYGPPTSVNRRYMLSPYVRASNPSSQPVETETGDVCISIDDKVVEGPHRGL